jgi:predicted HTH domain antitoxin
MTHILEILHREHRIDKEQINEEAYRLYFNLHPELKLEGVLALYLEEEISIGRAAELLGMTVPEFKELLAVRGIIRETEGKSADQMDRKLKELFAS